MLNAALIASFIITIAVAAVHGIPVPPPGGAPVIPMNQEEMAANVKKFSEVYKLATQLMNLGGKFLNNAEGSAAASSTAVRGGGGGGGLGGFGDFGTDNGVLGDSIRPQFRGVPNYDSNSGGSLFERATRAFTGGSSGYGPSANSNNFGAIAAPPSLSEYGGGPLGSGTGKVQSARTTALDSILNTFLGSSLGGAGGSSSGPSMTDFFNPNYKDYGSRSSRGGESGSNIEGLLSALQMSGAKPARPEPESRNLFSQFLG